MKLKFITSLLLILFCFSNCQPETEPSTEFQSENYTSEIKNDVITTNKASFYDEKLQIRMQWASFITAKMLVYKPFRSILKTHLNLNQTDRISLNDLIGSNPINSNIKTSFLNQLSYYFEELVTEPDPEKDKPATIFIGGVVGDGGIIIGTTNKFTETTPDGEWLSYWLKSNCIELYFPNLIIEPTANDFIIESTAHPLNKDTGNFGFTRYSNGINLEDGWYTETLVTDIDAQDLLTDNIVIVARPVKSLFGTLSGPDCSYSEYNGIEFTDFLDN